MYAQSADSGFEIEVNGKMVVAEPGDTVAAVLLRASLSIFRHTDAGRPRGIFCAMGVCFDCLVTIDDLGDQRACITLARPGMRVRTERPGVI